jgi:hypothetical protein
VVDTASGTKTDTSGPWPAFLRSLTTSRRRLVWVAAAVGLALRLLTAPAWGTQDIEWWKAWSSHVVKDGLRDVYGSASDAEIVELVAEGKTYPEIRSETQTTIHFKARHYKRTRYVLTQPPVYIYSISASTWLYSLFSPELENDRWFNASLNGPPIVYSALLALLIGWAAGRFLAPNLAVPAALLYWLNPLVILNSPVQGYQDPLCILFGTAALVALYERKLTLSVVLFVTSTLTKPQGVLMLPVIALVGVLEHGFRANLRAWLAGVATGVVLGLPFILMGRFFSVIVGVLSIADSSQDLTRQTLNLWWPAQYFANARELIANGYDVGTALLGGNPRVYRDRPMDVFAAESGVNAAFVGFVLLGIFTVLNLWSLRNRLRTDRLAMISAAAIQIYGYYMLRAGVQINHYFPLVPLLTIVALRNRANLRHYAILCALLLVQDLIFYGFGRDLRGFERTLSSASLGFSTVLLAVAALVYFRAWIAREIFGTGAKASHGSSLASPA